METERIEKTDVEFIRQAKRSLYYNIDLLFRTKRYTDDSWERTERIEVIIELYFIDLLDYADKDIELLKFFKEETNNLIEYFVEISNKNNQWEKYIEGIKNTMKLNLNILCSC